MTEEARKASAIEMPTMISGETPIEETKNLRVEDYEPNIFVLFVTEILGTAILLFLGCMGVCGPELVEIPVIPHFGGLGFGLTVLIVIQSIGHISGAHLNPQVTMAAVIFETIKPLLALVYIPAQFIGALLGYGLLKLVTPSQYSKTLCETEPEKNVTEIQALVVEIAITTILIIVCGGVWDKRNAKKQESVPIRFGLTVACISLVAGPYTGASMNTARSLAPVVINGNWNHYHWVYWVGPTVGALIGALFYKYILGVPKKYKIH